MEVKLENLTKIFSGKKGETTVAVDKMTFTIPDGKLVGLLGPSGCGKSTTLYMIAGLHKPTGGKIFFGDVDVTNVPPENRGIGLVFQNYALYPHFTVRGNILFPLENVKDYIDPETKVARRYTKVEMNTIAEKMATLVDIKPYLERKPKQLSGGQQQRVAIARALAKSPRVLLLDEPLSNLDARLRLQTREEIKRIQRETGITTIFVTHDQEEAMSISDFIVVMDKGVVQQIDEPQKVYNEPVNLFVAKFLGSPAINMLEGELRSGNLYLGDKIFDKGYVAKGNLALDSKEVYSLLSANGYKGTFEDYDALVHGTISIPSEEDKKKMVTIPFELTIENIVNATKKQGLLLDAKSLSYKIEELKVTGKYNRKAFIGIRPEAFIIDETNPFKIPVKVEYIEHIGRDVSLIGKTEKDAKLRIIIPSDLSSKATAGTVKFSVKRFFVFETTGVRVK